MAYKNKLVCNPRTGQDILFLQTGNDTAGELLEMETTYNAHSKEPPAHYHPHQTEDFVVLSGELSVRIDGGVRVLKKGDALHVSKNKVHAMWNSSEATTKVAWKVRPALQTEYFLETITGLAMDGKTGKDGKPGLLQIAVTASKFAQVFRLAAPPFAVQKILFALLTPAAYLLGYKPTYKQYID